MKCTVSKDEEHSVPLKHKKFDTPFSLLMQDPHNQLEAYFALHPDARGTVGVDDIRDVTIRQIFADGPYNDLSFLVGNRQIVMVEAQSTWSENVVLRLVLYCAQIYQNIIEQQGLDIYKAGALALPAPEFVIIFTGERGNIPDELTLSTTVFKGMASSLEARARVISREGETSIISQYIGFCKVLKAQIALHGHSPKAIDETVRICQEKNYLNDFMEAHKHEVKTMLSTLFDQDKVWERYSNRIGQEKYDLGIEVGIEKGIEVGIEKGREEGLLEGWEEGLLAGREEGLLAGREEGREEGEQRKAAQIAKNLLALGISPEMIVSSTGLSLEDIESLD